MAWRPAQWWPAHGGAGIGKQAEVAVGLWGYGGDVGVAVASAISPL